MINCKSCNALLDDGVTECNYCHADPKTGTKQDAATNDETSQSPKKRKGKAVIVVLAVAGAVVLLLGALLLPSVIQGARMGASLNRLSHAEYLEQATQVNLSQLAQNFRDFRGEYLSVVGRVDDMAIAAVADELLITEGESQAVVYLNLSEFNLPAGSVVRFFGVGFGESHYAGHSDLVNYPVVWAEYWEVYDRGWAATQLSLAQLAQELAEYQGEYVSVVGRVEAAALDSIADEVLISDGEDMAVVFLDLEQFPFPVGSTVRFYGVGHGEDWFIGHDDFVEYPVVWADYWELVE